jgi:hypothetical protein
MGVAFGLLVVAVILLVVILILVAVILSNQTSSVSSKIGGMGWSQLLPHGQGDFSQVSFPESANIEVGDIIKQTCSCPFITENGRRVCPC